MVNQSKTTSKRGHVHVRERLQMYMNFGLKTSKDLSTFMTKK